jgi:hypothetical protein
MEQTINTFIGGLDRDTSKNKFAPHKYYNLVNGRLNWNDEISSSSIFNIRGNIELLDDEGTNINTAVTNYKLVGWCTINNDIILFYKHISTTSARIYRLIQINELVFDFDVNNYVYQGNLDLGEKVIAIGRYESEDIQKVYFIDLNDDGTHRNNLRFFNIVGGSGIEPERLDIVQDIKLNEPVFSSYTSGNLLSGTIQYAYRLYNNYGIETVFSPLSQVIPLFQSSIYSAVFQGSSANTDTGKGINLTITLVQDTSKYDNIEVIALHYNEKESTPVINIVGKYPIANTINIVDTGNSYIGTLTLDEYTMVKNPIYAKTMTVRDNRLFIGNIKETIYWDDELENWDAQSYRYNSNGNTYVGNPLETEDSLNPYNILDNDGDSNYVYKYQINGSTIGGTGVNISYNFNTYESYNLDNDDGSDLFKRSLSQSKSSSDKDWVLGIKRNFQRDEIYRFGIVFFNKKMQQSFVKWIGDIRMPNLYDRNIINRSINTTYANTMCPIFTVSNFPTSAIAFQIVYVKREEWDKTVVAQGLGLALYYNSSVGRYNAIANIDYPDDGHLDVLKTQPTVDILTPYVTFSNSFNVADRIDLIGKYLRSDYTSVQAPYAERARTVKYRNITALNSGIERKTISDMQKLKPLQYTVINGLSQIAYVNESDDNRSGGWAGIRGTSIIVNVNSNWDAGSTDWGMFNIRKKIYPYGGYTYIARQTNTYIPASEIQFINNTNPITTTCYYGDTYICYYECLRTLWSDGLGHGEPTQDWVYIPLETSFNLIYRQDINTNSRALNQSVPSPSADILDRYSSTDYYWVSEDNLYKYNSAYSRVNNTNISIPKPSTVLNVIVKPSEIKYSDFKYDNEIKDSWLSFRTNNNNSVIGNYGEISHLQELNNQVYCFQTNAISLCSINRQELTTGSSGTTIVLGKGGVLDRFDYLSTEIGCILKSQIVKTPSSLFWIDVYRKKLYRISPTGFESYGDNKLVSSIFKESIDNYSWLHGIYYNNTVFLSVKNTYPNYVALVDKLDAEPRYYKLLFDNGSIVKDTFTNKDTYENTTFFVGNTYSINGKDYLVTDIGRYYIKIYDVTGTSTINDGDLIDIRDYVKYPNEFTLLYSELLQEFEGFQTIYPDIYIKNNQSLFTYLNVNTKNNSYNNRLWLHNIGYFGKFYNSTSYDNLILEIIVNVGGNDILEFNNVEWLCEVTSNSQDIINESLHYIQGENTYQQSELIKLYPIQNDNDIEYDEGFNIPTFLSYSAGTYNKYEVVTYNGNNYISLKNSNTTIPSNDHINWETYNLYNCRRTVRNWSTMMPRTYSYTERDLINNVDTIITKHNRLRDFYVKIRFVFVNDGTKKLMLHDIRTNYERV